MSITLDVALRHSFWSSTEEGRLHAGLEAANTGSAVLRVDAIEVRKNAIFFIGTVPTGSIQGNAIDSGRRIVQPHGFGKFHTTWDSLIHSRDPLGFLVLQHPVKLIGGDIKGDAESVAVAVEVTRCSSSLPRGFIGHVCCVRCNEPITEPRLRAMPSVRTCTNCQRLIEEESNK